MIVKAYFDGEFHSVASLQKYIGKYGAFGPLVLMTFQAMQVIIPVLPGFLGCGMGSVMFGVGTGFLSGSLFWENRGARWHIAWDFLLSDKSFHPLMTA